MGNRRTRKIKQGGGWTPLSLAGCVLWLDASRITGLNDADPVGTWTDLSASGNDAIQETADNKPVYKTNIQNGRPVVRFAEPGAIDYMQCGSAAFSGAGARTIIAVYKSTSTGGYVDSICGQSASDTANTWCMIQARTNGPQGDPYIAGYANDLGAAVPDNAWKISTLTFDGTTGTNFKNGTQQSTGDKSAWNTSNTGFRVGYSSTAGNEPLDGDIAEIIVYNTALSTADRGVVEDYLSDKWGIALA